MKHMMIDLETLATSANALVVSVGACTFDQHQIYKKGYWVLNQTEQHRKGRAISPSTVQWWMGQNDQARSVFKEKEVLTLEKFAIAFALFFEGEQFHLWGNGADFDLSIMIDLWERHSLEKIPGWRYYNHMCYRTFKTLFKCGNLTTRQGTHHNALDDAIFQAENVIASGKLSV
jgi:hypothetical protein